MQTTDEDDAGALKIDPRQAAEASTGPAWMRILLAQCNRWLTLLPERLTTLNRTAESIKNPLFRFFDREISIAAKLLKQVRFEACHVVYGVELIHRIHRSISGS